MSGQQYAELFCFSNFTFLTGASHPHELAERAHELSYTALAITDACSVAGIPPGLGGAGRKSCKTHYRQLV